MNLSAEPVALVPIGVVTVTSTVVALPDDGEFTVIWVAEMTIILVPALVPNLTAVAPIKLVPVIVTAVLPVSGPETGEIPVTVGAVSYVKWSLILVALVATALVTVTSTVLPTVPEGEVAVIWVDEFTV